jgi:hypothetical protein
MLNLLVQQQFKKDAIKEFTKNALDLESDVNKFGQSFVQVKCMDRFNR